MVRTQRCRSRTAKAGKPGSFPAPRFCGVQRSEAKGGTGMRSKTILISTVLFLATVSLGAQAAEARQFSFAYDQAHTTAYGIAADIFANQLQELSKGTMVIDQFPGAQLGQEPQVLQKLRTGDI